MNRLTKLAVQSHRTVLDVVREAIEMYVVGGSHEEGSVTPYDCLAHIIGRVDSGGTLRSVGTGRAFTARLRERQRARRAR